MRRNLIQVHPIWTNLCKSNKNQNMGYLQKPGFSRKKQVFFFTGPTIFWVFEAPGIYIIYIITFIYARTHVTMCVRIHVRVYVRRYVMIYIRVFAMIYLRMYVMISVRVYVRVYARVFVRIFVRVYIRCIHLVSVRRYLRMPV